MRKCLSKVASARKNEDATVRWTLHRPSGRLTETVIDDRGDEFPRINWRYGGQACRYVYSAHWGRRGLRHTICFLMRRGVRLHSVEVSMNVLNRRWLFRVGVGLLGALLAIQLVPYGRDHSNPPLRSEPPWDSPTTRALAKQACFDCHSNETEWPAYASIAPASWLVQHDVDEGRAVLNFSEWQRPQEEATKASEELLEGEMPPAAYLLMHAHARLARRTATASRRAWRRPWAALRNRGARARALA